jgi:hypothetical protein
MRFRLALTTDKLVGMLMGMGLMAGFLWVQNNLTPDPNISALKEPTNSDSVLHNGIFPLMRDWQCGHSNLEVPRILQQEGRQRVVVDIGLGPDADETFEALRRGWVVLSVELLADNVQAIKRKVQALPSDLRSRVYFVPTKPGHAPDVSSLPRAPPGGGFVYIFHGGLADHVGATDVAGSDTISHIKEGANGGGNTPLFTLESIVPTWVESIFFIKIDTQGHESGVLSGSKSIWQQQGKVLYVLFEFSPKLMKGDGFNQAHQMALLEELPKHGYVCLDVMGFHNMLPRPSTPFTAYFDTLNNGQNVENHPASGTVNHVMNPNDLFGTWDDILCVNFNYWKFHENYAIPHD